MHLSKNNGEIGFVNQLFVFLVAMGIALTYQEEGDLLCSYNETRQCRKFLNEYPHSVQKFRCKISSHSHEGHVTT